MPTYIFRGKYSPAAYQGMLAAPSDRGAMSRPQLKVELVAEMIMRPFSTGQKQAAWHGQAQRFSHSHASA